MVILLKFGALGMDIPQVQALVVQLRECATQYPIILCPGGGSFADIIRFLDTRYDIGRDAAHWLAIHSMDSLGLLINLTCPGTRAIADFQELHTWCRFQPPILEDALPEIPVWLPYTWLRAHDPSPHSWDVTADSLAIFCGAALGVDWVGLAKLTDHLNDDMPFVDYPSIDANQLQDWMDAKPPKATFKSWVIDPFLPQAINIEQVSCRIFDARDPLAVATLVMGGEDGAPCVEVRPSVAGQFDRTCTGKTKPSNT